MIRPKDEWLSVAVTFALLCSGSGAASATTKAKTVSVGETQLTVSELGPRHLAEIKDLKTQIIVLKFALPAPGLVDMRQWSFKEGQGLWMTLEYAWGSTQRIVLCGPTKGGKWKVVLSVDSDFGAFHPPEVVDLRGNGMADIITIKEVGFLHNPRRFDPKTTVCSVWRWNDVRQAYLKTKDCSYPTRLRGH